MSNYLPDKSFSIIPAAKPARVREIFEIHRLKDHTIERLDFVAAAVCEVDACLELDDGPQKAQLRWIREKPGSLEPAIIEEEGEWHLYTWSPQAMIGRRK